MNKQDFKSLPGTEHPVTPAAQKKRQPADKRVVHLAYLSLGSNIQPQENLRRAVQMLGSVGQVQAVSRCFETLAVGSDGKPHQEQPNFLNMALCLATPMDAVQLKTGVIEAIERTLGRVRTADKYAPRPIDLDIIVFDGEVLDPHLWQRLFIALPFAELLPDLVNPYSGETLQQAAQRMLAAEQAVPRLAVVFPDGDVSQR